jgi:hypothetical protein
MSDRMGIQCHFDGATKELKNGADQKVEPITYGTLPLS